MTCSRRQLLWGACVLILWISVTGIRYLPEKAINFTKCSPTSEDCPSHSHCVETRKGYYCACDKGFYNDKERLTITYPGGKCTALCTREGSSSPCVCNSGFIRKKNDKDLFYCTDKCTGNGDCPGNVSCRSQICYCPDGQCNSVYVPQCIPWIRLDEECAAPSTGPPEKITSSVQTSKTTATMQSTHWRTSTVPIPQTSQPENKRCEPQYSKELEECAQSMRQDAFCSLLRENARIQEQSCQTTKTNISVEQVVQELNSVLNHVALTNLSTSEQRLAVTSIVNSVQNSLLEKFSKDLQNRNISTPELEVQMKVSRDLCGKGAPSIILTVVDNTMRVPCTHVPGNTDGAILITYKGLGEIGESDHENTEKINSPIISGAITNPNTENLDPPVAFYLNQLKAVPPSFVVQCVFWDTETMVWSNRGCETKKSDRVNSTLCVCNHLSTFAVLMAPGDIQEDDGLILISWIGLSVSLVCLCLSILTFTLCRSIRSAHTSVLTALCGCLFVGQLLVLFGLHQTGNKILCAVIAGLLQFSFLCAFCWMSLESSLLFMTIRNLQALNYMTSQRSHFPYVCIAGFGIPLIIIIISAAMRPDAYGTEKYCWLRPNLIWSFLGPVCVFLTINFTLLVLTFALLRQKVSSLNSNVSSIKNTRLLTFKALSQLFILGCTWIFGLFQFGSGSLVMSYIFTICNSFQGLYIFCVHCLLNRQVWKEYMRGFRSFHSKKSETEETNYGNTMPTTLKSAGNTDETFLRQEKIYENLLCRQAGPTFPLESRYTDAARATLCGSNCHNSKHNPKEGAMFVPSKNQASAVTHL
ncbi:adhesion G protein-coupled receptor E3-like isoform X2 [Aquarana catesbeiana]|uniref:adhesion G protein-coupled receptor E3-like isoform X2 n=1 Tax=Aquarana catesbeiana TaxID=8400 RepID=UPI003CCA1B24